jgi:hypothetical protein
MKLFAVSLLAALAVSTVAVQATQPGRSAVLNWKIMDVCAKQAQTAYPDYNAESNARRDEALNQCLNANMLPPRQPSAKPDAR